MRGSFTETLTIQCCCMVTIVSPGVSQHSTPQVSERTVQVAECLPFIFFVLNNCDLVFLKSHQIQYNFSSKAHYYWGQTHVSAYLWNIDRSVQTSRAAVKIYVSLDKMKMNAFLTSKPEVRRWLYSWLHLIIHLIIAMPYGHYGSDSELRLHWASQTSNQNYAN